jgi:hypothetical protein
MNRHIKIFFLLIICLNLISCNEKHEENYPQTVSQMDDCGNIKSRFEIEISYLEEFPEYLQDSAKNYLIGKIGKPFFDQTVFNYGYIFSNQPINTKSKKNDYFDIIYGEGSKEDRELDFKTNYPFYCFSFEFSDLSKGIEKYDLNFVIDNNGKFIKHIAFLMLKQKV